MQIAADTGVMWLHLPFADTSAPKTKWWEMCQAAFPMLHTALEDGGEMVIRCRAGLERSAMVAALLQVERGVFLNAALSIIGRARSGAGQLATRQRRWLSPSYTTLLDTILGSAIR